MLSRKRVPCTTWPSVMKFPSFGTARRERQPSVGRQLNQHRATTVDAATRLGGCYRRLGRATACEAIQAKHTPDRAALRCTFFGRRFLTQMKGRPARSACANRDISVSGRSVIKHALDGEGFVL